MKHYILDKRIVHAAVIALIIETIVIVIIGSNNISTTNANHNLEKQIELQKAKAKYWEGRFLDLSQSSTCLERDPNLETS